VTFVISDTLIVDNIYIYTQFLNISLISKQYLHDYEYHVMLHMACKIFYLLINLPKIHHLRNIEMNYESSPLHNLMLDEKSVLQIQINQNDSFGDMIIALP